MKTHDRQFFYKYLGARGAIATLSQLTARWSSPLRFNDPFDSRFGLSFGFRMEDTASALAARVDTIVMSDEPLPAEMPSILINAVERGRKLRRLGATLEQLRSPLEALQKAARGASTRHAEEVERWRKYQRAMRIYCISEVYDDLLMWAHYAECHRGAVIRLKCLPEIDNVICGALPVRYQPQIPFFAETIEEWVSHLCGNKRLDTKGHFVRCISTKSDHWSYEKEWRCLDNAEDTGKQVSELFTDINLHPEEITGVYLGCQISEADRTEVLRIVEQYLNHAQVFQARLSETVFGLDFDEVR